MTVHALKLLKKKIIRSDVPLAKENRVRNGQLGNIKKGQKGVSEAVDDGYSFHGDMITSPVISMSGSVFDVTFHFIPSSVKGGTGKRNLFFRGTQFIVYFGSFDGDLTDFTTGRSDLR
ncbi:hypothetical protein TNIN_283391 [Trichonephila inaurata madagascariensis]|uniref:Uncharacterized protein n=1 Tax=Trichonephila inaurata madagascariensis TaxID=2747483 RepID=A0A8X7C7A2_9ARAC|nr:hypothetical protein TNIN_283391 [Trichonephila inaurata madagascariensis]